MVCTDIAQIEARHASNREASLMRAKGWLASLAMLSSKFVLHFARKLRSFVGPKSMGEQAKPEQQKQQKRRRGGGGGPWRVFVHHMSQGIRLTAAFLSDLSRQYRRLTPEEKLRYVEAGEAATLSHRIGFKSFPNHVKSSSAPSVAEPMMQPGDITSTGAMVAADYSLALQQGLLQYTGPDFFREQYSCLKSEVGKRGVRRDEDGLTVEEQEELEQFRGRDISSNGVVSHLHELEHTQVTGALAASGSQLTSLNVLHYVPPMQEAAKATWQLLAAKGPLRFLQSFGLGEL